MFGFYDSYFKFFGLSISYYGFLIALGMGLGVFIACKLAKFRGLKSEDILKVACYVLPLAVIGARLYYVIFSGETYSFLEIFEIWNGGMAIYGGVIGGALGIVLFCLIHKKNFLDVADLVVVVLALGQALGRIGCYFSDCCYGIEVTNKNLMWFPLSSKINGVWHYSTHLYESFLNLIIFTILILLITKKVKTRGVMSSLYLICYGIVRCIIETFRGDSLYIGSIKVSQLLSILLIIAGISMILIIYGLKKEKENTHTNDNIKIDSQEIQIVDEEKLNLEENKEKEEHENKT